MTKIDLSHIKNKSYLMRFFWRRPLLTSYSNDGYVGGLYISQTSEITSIVCERDLEWKCIAFLSNSNIENVTQNEVDLFQSNLFDLEVEESANVAASINSGNFRLLFQSLQSKRDWLYMLDIARAGHGDSEHYLVQIVSVGEQRLVVKTIDELCQASDQLEVRFDDIIAVYFGGYEASYSQQYFCYSENMIEPKIRFNNSDIITLPYDAENIESDANYFGLKFLEGDDFLGLFLVDDFTINGIKLISKDLQPILPTTEENIFQAGLVRNDIDEWREYAKDLKGSNFFHLLSSILNEYGGSLVGIDYKFEGKLEFALADLIEVEEHWITIEPIGILAEEFESERIEIQSIVAITLADRYSSAYSEYLWEASQ